MLSLRIAVRFLRKSPIQSILIAAGIAVGIGVQVFLAPLSRACRRASWTRRSAAVRSWW
jgi:ABC-type lipoprotein release transport system permease subunit